MPRVTIRNAAGSTMIVVELRDGEIVFSKEGPVKEAVLRARVHKRGKRLSPEDGLKWLRELPHVFNGTRVRAEFEEEVP